MRYIIILENRKWEERKKRDEKKESMNIAAEVLQCIGNSSKQKIGK